jgi:hypothetical protein
VLKDRFHIEVAQLQQQNKETMEEEKTVMELRLARTQKELEATRQKLRRFFCARNTTSRNTCCSLQTIRIFVKYYHQRL